MSLLSKENNSDDLFSFTGSVGRFGDNHRDDVIKAQALLANAGYYDLPAPGMPTGWPGGELNRALIRFQKDHGLEPDGTLLPLDPSGVTQTGVGETVQALQDELGDRLKGLAAPDMQEADDFYRIQPMLDGDDRPPTNVRLHGDDGAGEYVGLKPIASDAPPADYKLKPGQQEARGPTGPKIDTKIPRPSEAKPPVVPEILRRLGIASSILGQGLPADTPQPDLDAQRPPEPAQPEEDRQQQDFARPQRGRIIIAEDGKELHVPPLGTWADDLNLRDRQIAEALNDALAEEMAIKHGGSRGSKQTQEGVNAALQGCIEALRVVLPEAEITHVAGGNRKGNADDKDLKEEDLGEYDEDGKWVRKGSNRSDWTIVIARNVATALRGNTYDTQGGKIAGRESSAETGIRNKTDGDQMAMVEKRGRNRTEEDIRRDAYNACYDAGLQIRSDWTKRGEFEQPKPDVPAEYEGPANARRAREIRRMQGKK